MSDPRPREERRPAAPGAGAGDDTPGQAGVIGIGLAAVLTFALAQGSWQWFATYIGVTLFAVVFAFQVRPAWRPGVRTAYMRALVAYALVVGLCVAIAVAPVLQRGDWLFPMPGTRSRCGEIGRYEVLRTRAAVAGLPGGGAVPASVRESRREEAVADCLASTTTLWLPLYGAGAAVLVGAGAWYRDRNRAGRRPRAGSGPRQPADAAAGPGPGPA
ncbi:hypothetical protein [Streptomyces sp. TN58]|uniref:hypothetical protein n=1 Tax=Streptomyces sp. TN58 TaxID=234612 RepID=UPI000950971A|nr:hypothetical protein [Streptomyces sp. TN58]APU38538.1 hypothetical protein BSL84_00845 [Streptomyces sp. TN58]APU43928.1 hypothetical protein BSL84_33655 [Streptomyces sp. TN58]